MSRRMEIIRVSCNQHGAMKYDPRADHWVCTGWAGEGCLTAMIVTGKQALAGHVPGATIEWRAA